MKYVAFLRGINVGGNNIIKMIALKEAFEKSGFKNVGTFIQSGNVIFETDEKKLEKITGRIEKDLSKTFSYASRVVVRSYTQLKEILAKVPADWRKRDDLRKYIAFIKEPVSENEVLSEIELKEEIDFVKIGPGVLYMTTLMSGLTKSKFNKLVGKKIYKDITIRNYNTTQKILKLMK